VIRDAPLVYIDIGASEHVLLGMTFEVYDKSSGIVTDEFGTLRGKATVEVVRVEAGSSLCRIVRRDNGSLIYEGDIIGNAVYDPNMTLRFHVYGEFDIE